MHIIEIHDEKGERLGFVKDGKIVGTVVEATRYPEVAEAAAAAAQVMIEAKTLFPFEWEVYVGVWEI